MAAKRTPTDTRQKILRAAFAEFHANGFQGGSLNNIVDSADATKGAVFHHFESKNELGYAVVEEVLLPLLKEQWLDPLAGSIDPVADLKQLFRRQIKLAIEGGVELGCPLNNLAQEMSRLDAGFRKRIENNYRLWRESIAAALTRGQKAAKVRKDVSPRNVAALVVAAQMGIWGTAKNTQSPELMTQLGEALCACLDSLEP